MRLQTEGAPNPADRHAAEPGGLGQAAPAPMRLGARCTFQGLNHNLLDLSIADFARRSRSRLVIESFQATPQKSGTLLAHHAQRAAQVSSPRSGSRVPGRRPAPPAPAEPAPAGCARDGPAIEAFLLVLSQSQWPFGASGSHLS